MPNPNPLFRELGLWSRWQLPSKSVQKVLQHMQLPGVLLYVQISEKGSRSASVTHSQSETESVMGWNTMIDTRTTFQSGFIEVDEEATSRCVPHVTAYRLSDKGREALAQAEAIEEVVRFMQWNVPRILKKAREKYQAPLPAK